MYECACGLLTTFGYIDGATPRKKAKKKTKAEQDAKSYKPLCFECWCSGGQKEALAHMPSDDMEHPNFAPLSPEVQAMADEQEKKKTKTEKPEEKREDTKSQGDHEQETI